MSSQIPAFNQSHVFKHTESPNPGWTFGQKVEETPEGRKWRDGEKEGWKVVDTEKEDPKKLYALMISGIVPRPIAFVSTISDAGTENIAPFSWFNMVTHNPPIVSISCSIGTARLKDTVNNIRANKGFVVNIISEPWVQNANICSIDAPEEYGEWPISGLTREKSIHVKPPRVKESAFSMECELFAIHDITHPTTGRLTTALILGHVKYIHVRNDMLTPKGTVDPARLQPVSRLGDISYARLGDAFRIARPTWENAKDEIHEVVKTLE